MIVLSITYGKPSTAAVMIDNQIISAISEERLCRKKMAMGMPRQAISRVMAEAGISSDEINYVAVASKAGSFKPEPIAWSGWFDKNPDQQKQILTQMSSLLAPLVGNMPISWQIHHKTRLFLYHGSLRKKLSALLRDAYGITAPVHFYDHHYCHATSSAQRLCQFLLR